MARRRASMREGPLAELFRATEAAQRQAEGEPEQQPLRAGEPTRRAEAEPDERTVEHVPSWEEAARCSGRDARAGAAVAPARPAAAAARAGSRPPARAAAGPDRRPRSARAPPALRRAPPRDALRRSAARAAGAPAPRAACATPARTSR